MSLATNSHTIARNATRRLTEQTPLANDLRRRHEMSRQIDAEEGSGATLAALAHRVELDEHDELIARRYGVDAAFRGVVHRGGSVELPNVRNAITGSTTIGARSFRDSFFTAAVQAAPLLALAQRLDTSVGGYVDWSYIASNITGALTAQGATISSTDPVWGGTSELAAYGYKSLFDLSSESVTDAAVDIEGMAGEVVGPVLARALSTDLWGGNGTSKPLGLLAGLTTVAAAGAAIVTFDDIAALLNGVPAANRYSGRCTILLAAGAHIDLMEEQPLYDWASGKLFGFPFFIDTALDDPATGKKSVVAGDFKSAYVVRTMPLQIATDNTGSGFATDKIRVRVVLRADGTRMVTDACRALAHP